VSIPGMLQRIICTLFACYLGAGWASASELVVVSGDKSPGYSEAAQTIAADWLRAGADKSEAQVLFLTDPAALDSPLLPAARIIVTMGSDALQKILAKDLRVPIIAALIPKAGFERILRDQAKRPAFPVIALYLEQPFPRQIELLKLALPDAKKVGVLWGAESGIQASSLLAGLQARGMELVSGYVGGTNNLFSGLKAVLDDTDVLLAVPDPQVYNGSSISTVLLATYRARVPVVAFSPAYVRAGALMSLHSTPKQIGQQAALMVKALLQGNGALSSQYPADYTIVLNDHVARSLGLNLDEQSLTERLRRWEKRQ
jgi:putative ABC transport system substrate-binding protein